MTAGKIDIDTQHNRNDWHSTVKLFLFVVKPVFIFYKWDGNYIVQIKCCAHKNINTSCILYTNLQPRNTCIVVVIEQLKKKLVVSYNGQNLFHKGDLKITVGHYKVSYFNKNS